MELFREKINIFKEKTKIAKGIQSKDKQSDLFHEFFLTPHQEMRECKKAYNTNGLISSAVDSLTDFILGNDLSVECNDTSTKAFFQDIIDNSDPDMFEVIREAVENTIKTGNGYIEVDWDDNGLPKSFYGVSDSSRIYLNTDAFGEPLKTKYFNPVTEKTEIVENLEEFYIQEVPTNFKGDGRVNPKWFELTYSFGNYKENKIYGIPIHKNKLIHLKWGVDDSGLYGRSFIASILDDHEILKRIEKAMGIIAKHKAIPKKIISPADDEEFSPEDINELAMYFEGLEDDENAITWKKMKIDDLSYNGKEINMSSTIDHIRRKIISGLAPEFLIGYGMDTNRATAEQLLIAFMLRLETKRRIWEKQIERFFILPYKRKYNWLSKAKISFGNIDFRTPEEKNNEIRAKWQNNQITFNEMRAQLNMTTAENGNVFYKDFIKQEEKNKTIDGEKQKQIIKRAVELMKEIK